MVNYGVLLEAWEGDWDAALTWYKRALAVDPGNQRALLHRGRIYEDETLDLDAAQDFYSQAGTRGRDRWLAAEGLWRAGLIQWKSFNDTARAYSLLTRAADACPTHPHALHALAALEALCGDIEDAVALYQRAVQALPSDADTLGELADVLQGTGQIDESEKTYLAAISLRPTDVDVLRGYAHLLKNHRGQAGMASQLYQSCRDIEVERKRIDTLEQESLDRMLSDNSTIPVSLVEVIDFRQLLPYTHLRVASSGTDGLDVWIPVKHTYPPRSRLPLLHHLGVLDAPFILPCMRRPENFFFSSASSSSAWSSPPRVQSHIRCSQTDVKSREEEWMYLVCFCLPCCRCPDPCSSERERDRERDRERKRERERERERVPPPAASSSPFLLSGCGPLLSSLARPSRTVANGRGTVRPLRFAACNAVVIGSIAGREVLGGFNPCVEFLNHVEGRCERGGVNTVRHG